MKKIIVYVTLCILGMGCSQNVTNEASFADHEKQAVRPPVMFGLPAPNSKASLANHASSGRNLYAEAFSPFIDVFKGLIDGITDDNRIQVQQLIVEKLKQYENEDSLFLLEQMIGSAIAAKVFQEPGITDLCMKLPEHAEKSSLTSNEAHILGYSAKLLVKNNNPNTDLLDLLINKSALSPAEKRSLKKEALEDGIAWLQKKCSKCLQNESLKTGFGVRDQQIQTAIQALAREV